jgi:hypothetical protein
MAAKSFKISVKARANGSLSHRTVSAAAKPEFAGAP